MTEQVCAQCLEYPGTILNVMAAMRNPKSVHPKKGPSRAVKHTTTQKGPVSTMRPVTTKSVNAKGNEIEIAGTPNKRGKQIVFSPKTRKGGYIEMCDS